MSITDTDVRTPDVKLPPIRGWWCWAASALSGLLIGLCHPPVGAGPLIFLAFVPWLLALRGFRTGIGAILGSFACGMIANLIPMAYLNDMVGYAGTDWAMTGLWVASSAILASTFAVVALPMRWMMARTDRRWWALIVPLLWMGAEELRYHFPVASPLLYVGYALYQIDALIQIAEIGSVHLVSGFVLFVAATITLALDGKLLRESNGKLFAPIAMASGFVIVLGFGMQRMAALDDAIELRGGPKIAVIQPNIPQELKNMPDGGPLWKVQKEMTVEAAQENPDLIIWSEAAFPYIIYPSGFLRDKDTGSSREPWLLASGLETPILVGAIIRPSEEELNRQEFSALSEKERKGATFNAALLYAKDGTLTSRHYKSELVPGGEEIPYRHTFIGTIVSTYAKSLLEGFDTSLLPGFRREQMKLTDKRDNEWRFSSKVCYEFAFPELACEIHNNPELPEDQRNVHFVATISNEGWYQGGAELDQALILSRFRAIESRTTVVRATNDGISAVIGPMGMVRERLEVDGVDRQVKGILHADLPYLIDPPMTFYLRMGNIPYRAMRWALLLSFSVIFVARIREKAKRRQENRGGVDSVTRALDKEEETDP